MNFPTIIKWVLCAAFSCLALNARFEEMPANCRLYPRDASNHGNVVIRGMVLENGRDSAVVVMTRNGALVTRERITLNYAGDSAQFQFNLRIPAELAEFGFTCYIDTQVAAFADSVVAGDAYIVDGQSNAGADGGGEWREYVRTVRLADSAWGLGSEGGWPQIIGREINWNHRIPVCIINGAVNSTAIVHHQKGTGGIYHDILKRAVWGKVQHSIKAIFWYQGEFNATPDAHVTYPPQFDTLYRSWMQDYTGVQKVYLMQINTWHSDGSRQIRDAERLMAHHYGNMAIMSTIGAPYYNGHGGWPELGANLSRLVARDFYGCRDTAGITPPEIQRAYYTSGARNRIALEFDQPVFWNAPKDTVVYLNSWKEPVAGYLKDYFGMDDSVWEAVDTCWFELGNRRIILALKAGQQPATISYMPDWYSLRGCNTMCGPVLWNARHVAALTFARVPVQEATASDTGAVTAFRLEAPKQTVSVFERLPLFGIADYSTGLADTNRYVTFTTPDTFLVRLEPHGFLRGMNPGTARIMAEKGGYRDTLQVTVGSGFAPMDSMGFALPCRALMAGDSMAVNLLGAFTDAAGNCNFLLDTLAAFQCDAGVLQIGRGWIRSTGLGDSTTVVALFAGLRCTLQVRILRVPSFIRRINFQPKGDSIQRIPDWNIDSCIGYAEGKGYGWLNPGAVNGAHSPLIPNYIKATCAWGWGEGNYGYRIDCPDGNYRIRLCASENLWQEPGVVRAGNDTLLINPQKHDGDNIHTNLQIWSSDSRVTVSGGLGLRLDIYGSIAYLVLISDDGADLNLVGKDDTPNLFAPQLSTGNEKPGDGDLGGFSCPIACPNPFNPATVIRFNIRKSMPGQKIKLAIYDVRGRLVRAMRLAAANAGPCQIAWDSRNDNGVRVGSGLYVCRLVYGNKKAELRLVLIK